MSYLQLHTQKQMKQVSSVLWLHPLDQEKPISKKRKKVKFDESLETSIYDQDIEDNIPDDEFQK